MIDRNWPSIHGFRANQVNCCIALNWTEVKWKVITRGQLIKLRVVSPKYSIRNRFPSSSRNRRENDFQANIPFVLPPIKSSADMLMHYRGGFDGCAKVVLQSISPQPQHSDPLQFIVLLPGSVTAPIIPHNNSICYLLRLLSSWWCSRGERQKNGICHKLSLQIATTTTRPTSILLKRNRNEREVCCWSKCLTNLQHKSRWAVDNHYKRMVAYGLWNGMK